MNMFRRLLFCSAVCALLAIASCERDDWPFPFPERCVAVAGVPELIINDTIRLPDEFTGGFWLANATSDARWAIDMENEDFIVGFHRGVMPFTEEEFNALTQEEWKQEVESRGSISLKNGIQDGRLWFFARQPDGTDLLLGDDPAEIVDGNITMRVVVVDGCDMLKVDLFCLMEDDAHSYRIEVKYHYPYHFK